MPHTLDSWRSLLEDPGAAADRGLGTFFTEGYPALSRVESTRRYRRLTEVFEQTTGASELRVARAPGRINLIGEHTDYNGLPVLPVAIDRDIAALFVPDESGQIHLANTDPAFPPPILPPRGVHPARPARGLVQLLQGRDPRAPAYPGP